MSRDGKQKKRQYLHTSAKLSMIYIKERIGYEI